MPTQTNKDILEEKQCVILKGRRDGISILLDDKAEFNLIKDVLRERVASSRSFFDGAKTSVNFKGRKLTPQEESVLLDIIRFEANLNVEKPAQEEKALPKNLRLIPESPPGLLPAKADTFFYRGGVRSGQTIRQNGSVVVIGDVNPGGEIKATGNIIILGSLKGTAWAGAPGGTGSDASCFVSALDFQPTQIRIANVITYIPEGTVKGARGSWAYILNDAIYIAPL